MAQALLQKAEFFAQAHGCREVMGNFNLTAMQQIGVVTKIISPDHYTDQVFAPVYISELLKKCGYKAEFPMQTHQMEVSSLEPEALLGPKQREILADPDYSFSPMRAKPLHEALEVIRICLNNGFSDNPMFVPLTEEEIYFQAKDMMLIVDEKITVVAKYKNQVVGALICIPNLNPFLRSIGSRIGLTTPYYFLKHKFTKESAIIIYYSVFKEFHSRGLNGVMLYQLLNALKKSGYKKLGGTWITADNKASIRQAEKLGGQIMHELHLFKKELA